MCYSGSAMSKKGVEAFLKCFRMLQLHFVNPFAVLLKHFPPFKSALFFGAPIILIASSYTRTCDIVICFPIIFEGFINTGSKLLLVYYLIPLKESRIMLSEYLHDC